jgi:hypothetical protein
VPTHHCTADDPLAFPPRHANTTSSASNTSWLAYNCYSYYTPFLKKTTYNARTKQWLADAMMNDAKANNSNKIVNS